MYKKVMRRQKGFTLVELAIVLVIIGLILGAILKGQGMIKNAKIKRVKSDIDSLVAAVYGYQDRYNYLPGDDPVDRWGIGTTGDGDGTWAETTDRTLAWRHLMYADFISGDPTQTSETVLAKRNPFGGAYYFRYNGTLGKNYVLVDNIPSDAAASLDEKYDDGTWNTGDIRANADYTGGLRDMYWYVF